MDEVIRGLERAWRENPTDTAKLMAYLIALLRAGRLAEVLELLLANFRLLSAEQIAELVRLIPGLGRLLQLLAELARAREAFGFAGGARAIEIEREIVELLAEHPELRPLYDALRPAVETVVRIVKALPTSITFGGLAEAGGVLLSGPVAILAGLLLPATKWWGPPDIDLGGWWRDPCDDLFHQITDAYADHMQERGDFPTGFTHGSVATMNLLASAGHVTTLCARFLRDCPAHKRTKSVQFIQQKLSQYATDYYNL